MFRRPSSDIPQDIISDAQRLPSECLDISSEDGSNDSSQAAQETADPVAPLEDERDSVDGSDAAAATSLTEVVPNEGIHECKMYGGSADRAF